MKKVLVISTSLRAVSNSHRLAEEFARGAQEVGNKVEVVTLHDKDIRFCRGCLACVKTGKCVIKDDAFEVAFQHVQSAGYGFSAGRLYISESK